MHRVYREGHGRREEAGRRPCHATAVKADDEDDEQQQQQQRQRKLTTTGSERASCSNNNHDDDVNFSDDSDSNTDEASGKEFKAPRVQITTKTILVLLLLLLPVLPPVLQVQRAVAARQCSSNGSRLPG